MCINMSSAQELLRGYREKHGLSCKEFALKLGIAEPTLRSLENGTRTITAERAKDIEEITAGEITRSTLRPDLFATAPTEDLP